MHEEKNHPLSPRSNMRFLGRQGGACCSGSGCSYRAGHHTVQCQAPKPKAHLLEHRPPGIRMDQGCKVFSMLMLRILMIHLFGYHT